MTLPRKQGVVWCPNCDWTGPEGSVEVVKENDNIGRTIRIRGCPECGVRLDTES